MAEVKVTMTEAFKEELEKYRRERNLKTIPEAILELAALQLKFQGQVMGKWGGNRKGIISEVDVDRIEVQLRGLPPLADDD